MPRPATSSRAPPSVPADLLRANPVQHVAALYALRLRDGHAEVQRTLEVLQHRVAREVGGDVRGALLEARVHVRADRAPASRLAREIDDACAGAGQRRYLRRGADGDDLAAADSRWLARRVPRPSTVMTAPLTNASSTRGCAMRHTRRARRGECGESAERTRQHASDRATC